METLIPKILAVYGDEHPMTMEVLDFMKSLDAEILISRDPKRLNKAILEKYAQWHQVIKKVVVILSPGVWDYELEQKAGDAFMRASQPIVFELGFWLGKLGRDRLVAVFYDQKRFRIPCEFFDCRFIAWQKNGLWKKELTEYLAE